MFSRINREYLDTVYIVAGSGDWSIMMIDMLGRGETYYRGNNTPISDILGEVSMYNPKQINVMG